MFNFIKKAGTGSMLDKEDKDRRKRDKKERKEKQKKDRSSMSADEMLRLDEVRRSLKIRGRRKDKDKLPLGITADYTADFLACLERDDSYGPATTPSVHGGAYTFSDSSETSLNSLNNPNTSYHHHQQQQQHRKVLPPVPPKPPKRGILKGPRVSVTHDSSSTNGTNVVNQHSTLVKNTLQNEVISYENITNGVETYNGSSSSRYLCRNNDTTISATAPTPTPMTNLLTVVSTSPSADSLTDTTNSSFATPPFSLSPIGESQGFHRWTRSGNLEDVNLPLPPIVPLKLPNPRVLTIQRQKAPRNDFGFSLRRAMILERNVVGNSCSGEVIMRAVVFAEPGTIVQHNNETGLLPGDKLLEVNGIHVEDKSREEIIDMIKRSKDFVTVKVQPVAELSELSRRSGHDGQEFVLDEVNIKGGTLRRSGSQRFNKLSKVCHAMCIINICHIYFLCNIVYNYH
ncbi:uncharacterized protein LOC112906617 [Agrilus planipennis]|uniref:Uncharacterized protein LOC108743939 n=1 Tax=Agrilus planipennis TaxID=224129 RepID=A0A1W4XFY3_AGRPL|nr:uncharacterized protein LOC108743939 [Agrilus planipennis]XP_018335042.1 uncharacterized protein LOC108743939 [Agrilus planipennis]XP_025836855.1 uncharacterized protein LOC112906617 [Agrilus planipennis]XP_025836858.1 uncharacterized protein LOC112906617 [Agrilus planipennis]